MAHAQKLDFVFPRNGWVHLNRWGRQFSRLLAAELCASAWVMLVDHVRRWRESTGYPLHSPVSPSFPLPCVIVCHQVPHELYHGLGKHRPRQHYLPTELWPRSGTSTAVTQPHIHCIVSMSGKWRHGKPEHAQTSSHPFRQKKGRYCSGLMFVGSGNCADVRGKMAEVKNCLEELAIIYYTNGHNIIVFGNINVLG